MLYMYIIHTPTNDYMQVYFYANLAFLLLFFLQAQQDPTSSNTPPNAPPTVPSVSLFYD